VISSLGFAVSRVVLFLDRRPAAKMEIEKPDRQLASGRYSSRRSIPSISDASAL
jgi:hypothetical protein